MNRGPEQSPAPEFDVDEVKVIKILHDFVLEIDEDEGFPFNIVNLSDNEQSGWLTRLHIKLAEKLGSELLESTTDGVVELSRGEAGKTLAQLAEDGRPLVFAWGDRKKEAPKDIFERYYVSILWGFKDRKSGTESPDYGRGQVHMKRTDIQLMSGKGKEDLPIPELATVHVPYSIKTTGRRGKRDARLVVGGGIDLEDVGDDMTLDLNRFPGSREATAGIVGAAALSAIIVIGTKVLRRK